MKKSFFTVPAKLCLVIVVAANLVSGCASYKVPKPLALGPAPHLISVNQIWSRKLDSTSSKFDMKVMDGKVAVASENGEVEVLDVATGQLRWRDQLKSALTSGVGFDGHIVSVVNAKNQVLALADGKELWRQSLPALVLTSPFVAGGRVFVLASDRSMYAFDAENGAHIWNRANVDSSLVLNVPGLLTSYENTLIAGLGGDVQGVDPMTGAELWSVRVAHGLGSSDVERLVDVVGGSSLFGHQLCVRSYQTNVSCVDAANRTLQWSKTSSGYTGISGDGNAIFGAEQDGRVSAWSRTSGVRLWSNDQLRFRQLTQPIVFEHSIVLGDETGTIYFLSTADGAQQLRLSADGSPIVSPPVRFNDVLMVITKKGSLFAFKAA